MPSGTCYTRRRGRDEERARQRAAKERKDARRAAGDRAARIAKGWTE